MKKNAMLLVLSLFAISSLFSPGSYADRHWDGDRHGQEWDRGHRDPHWRRDRGDFRGYERRGDFRGYEHRGGYREGFAWRGHEFRRGYPLPPRYRDGYYRVDDWRYRGLQPPPRGHYWSYIDGRYVLIAAATGVITAILMNN